MFGSLRNNIGTARNSNGSHLHSHASNRKQGNFKPEIPFQNNTGLPFTASQKGVQLPGADNQYHFAELSSVRLTSNKWIPVDTTLSYNMI